MSFRPNDGCVLSNAQVEQYASQFGAIARVSNTNGCVVVEFYDSRSAQSIIDSGTEMCIGGVIYHLEPVLARPAEWRRRAEMPPAPPGYDTSPKSRDEGADDFRRLRTLLDE